MTAGLVDANYHFIAYCLQQTNPFQASAEYLNAWAALVGLSRLAPANAVGTVTFTGTTNTLVPAGSTIVGPNGSLYITTANFNVGVQANAPIQAVAAGAAGNLGAGVSMTLQSPLAGVQSATVLNPPGCTGGADVETDTSLRSRTIFSFANPAMGGSSADFQSWCLQVPGCTRAFILPGYYPGPTSITVMPMFDVTEAAYNGFPQGTAGAATNEYRSPQQATGDCLAVANYLYSRQPVTPLVWVMPATVAPFAVTISGLGITNTLSYTTWSNTPTQMELSIVLAIQEVITLEANAYGNLIPVSQLYSAVGAVQGVTTFDIVSPNSSIVTPVGSLPVLVAVTFLP